MPDAQVQKVISHPHVRCICLDDYKCLAACMYIMYDCMNTFMIYFLENEQFDMRF